MPYPRKPNYDKAAMSATTIYLPRALHDWVRQRARELSVSEAGTVTQSEVIVRALSVYRARVEGVSGG